MNENAFFLPKPILKLVEARNEIQKEYFDNNLEFTLDGV